MMDLATIDTNTARLPSSYHAAKGALRACVSVDECKDWADKASALASYAKQAGDTQLEDMAKRIRARAMRRAGELLKQIEPAHGANQNISDGTGTNVLTRQNAAQDAGFSKRQQVTATRIATIPEDAFEDMVERGATVTELAAAGTQTCEPSQPTCFHSLMLLKAFKAHAKRLHEINLEMALDGLLPAQRAELRALIDRLDGMHDQIAVAI
jgi:hypothetical protein